MASSAPELPVSLDPLIAEAKRRAIQRRLFAAITGLAATVAVAAYLLVAHGGGGSAVSPAASSSYSTVTYVLHYPRTPNRKALDVACEGVIFSADACGGIPVTGYRFSHVTGLTRGQDGTWVTPTLRLVGTWNGHVFRVTSASPSKSVSPAQPDCQAHETGPMVRPSREALQRATAHVHIFLSMPCGHSYWFQVPAADQRTVSYLQRHFGKSILVAGVLHPSD